MAELLYLKEAEQVVTVAGASDKPKVGEDLSEIGVIERGVSSLRERRLPLPVQTQMLVITCKNVLGR